MRAYFWTNFYLSPIQKGIQTAHCTAELFLKYHEGMEAAVLKQWAKNHKTMIVLNGGNCAELRQTYMLLRNTASSVFLPFACFHEDEQSLNGAITCVGVVVDEEMVQFVEDMRAGQVEMSEEWTTRTLSEEERQVFIIAKLIAQSSLAN